jgi:hypothetical protein
MARQSIAGRYGYLWVTLAFFLFSLAGHWLFAWFAYADEQAQHGQPVETKGFVIETARDTLENWQSEFLQLIWQVCGLAVLLYVGSPQSKEGEDRLEAKMDLVIKKLDPQAGEAQIRELDRKFQRQ